MEALPSVPWLCIQLGCSIHTLTAISSSLKIAEVLVVIGKPIPAPQMLHFGTWLVMQVKGEVLGWGWRGGI